MSRLRIVLIIAALSAVSTTCTDATAPVAPSAVEIRPAGMATLYLGPGGGQQLQFTAQSVSLAGSTRDVSGVSWTTTAPQVLAIAANGIASAKRIGSAIVIARVGALRDSVWVVVRDVPVATLAIALDSIALEVGPNGGSTRTLSAVTRDSLGNRLTVPAVTWRSSNARIATMTDGGVITALGEGEAWVHASAGDQRDSSAVTVTPTLGAASAVDVRVSGAQWTQGIQRNDGSIPMISGGRAAVLNVTTSATGSIATPMQFVLRLFSSRGVPVHAETTSVSILSGMSTNREPTLQFLVPSQLLRPGVRWEILRDPNHRSPEGAEGGEVFPLTGHTQLHVATQPPLRIRFVPIVLAAHGSERGALSTSLLHYYTETLRALFPHGRIEAAAGAAHRTQLRFGSGTTGGDAEFWRALLAELDTRRIADPAYADEYWVGLVRPPAGFSFSTMGGMGYVPSDGQSFDPGTRTSVVVGANWFLNERHSRDLVAHELGHNLGRLHAPCGTGASLDLSYPDVGGAVGEGAHDTYSWERGLTAGAVALSSGMADVMGYCKPLWISAHTYVAMIEFREPRMLALREPEPAGIRQRVLLVSGRVDGQGVRLNAPETVEAMPSKPVASGAWVVEGLAADGELLFSRPFKLLRVDHADDIQPFAVALPFDEETERRLQTVRVRGPQGRAAWP